MKVTMTAPTTGTRMTAAPQEPAGVNRLEVVVNGDDAEEEKVVDEADHGPEQPRPTSRNDPHDCGKSTQWREAEMNRFLL